MDALDTALDNDAAVARLYDLATRGDARDPELLQLDAVVYGRLMRTYGCNDDDAAPPALTVRI